MADRDAVLHLVYEAVDEVNGQLPADEQLTKTPETVLSSDSGGLDSLALINLVVEVESRTDQAMGKTVTLVTEDAFGRKPSPFSTIGSLVEYVCDLLDDTSRS